MTAARACGWCTRALEPGQARWCSKRCRQTAWRARRIAVAEDLGDTPKRLCYADPPYPGKAKRYYGKQPDYAGEVDHEALIARLVEYDGWGLSTSAEALRDVLPMCPPEARTAPWVKPNGVPSTTRGPHNSWEPLIFVPARLRRPGVRDWLSAKPARGGGTLMGRKSIAFCMWMFGLLGASSVDELDDLFPGTGIVTRCWWQFSGSPRPGGDEASARATSDASLPAPSDASLNPRGDASRAAAGDVSSCSPRQLSIEYFSDASAAGVGDEGRP